MKTKFGFKKKPLAVSRKGADVLQIRRMNYGPASARSVNRAQRGIPQADNLISRLSYKIGWNWLGSHMSSGAVRNKRLGSSSRKDYFFLTTAPV